MDLLDRMRSDEGLRGSDIRHRDRAIGERLGHLDGRPAAKLAAWVRATRAGQSPGLATAEAVRVAILLLAGVGFLVGVSAAIGAFSFQPRGRINVVAVLGLLVGVPGIFLAFALLGALPERARRWLPWLGSESVGGGLLQPTRWALRALPQRPREILEQALGSAGSLGRLTAPLWRWLLLVGSQAAAAAFQTGALLAALAQVVFTDLSFGWSTTLEVDADSIARIVSAVSAPWARLWPEAAPSLALVESTRFFRIAPDPHEAVTVYGRWWPFVAMCLLVYGWLPRVVFLLVARWRFGAALRRAMVEAPGSRRLLDRLESPLLESGAAESEARRDAAGEVASDAADAAVPARAVVLSWGEAFAGAADAATLEGCAVTRHEAGGRLAPEEDARAIANAAADAGEHDLPILVAVRGYEPPLAEQLDLLLELRRKLGDGREIVVAAVGAGGARLAAWRKRLASLGDPWLSLAAVAGREDVPR